MPTPNYDRNGLAAACLQLGQNAAELSVIEYQVVRPLELRFVRAELVQRLHDADANRQCQAGKVVRHFGERQRCRHVQARHRRGVPLIVHASAPGCLVISDGHAPVTRHRWCLVHQVGIGGFYFGEHFDHVDPIAPLLGNRLPNAFGLSRIHRLTSAVSCGITMPDRFCSPFRRAFEKCSNGDYRSGTAP